MAEAPGFSAGSGGLHPFAAGSGDHGSQYCEVAFERVEADAVTEVRRIYETLNLPGFDSINPALQNYVKTLAGCQKNSFPDLSNELKQRLQREWKRCFDEWEYAG